jgi:Ca2+-binding RTX toxin-like protein
MSIPVTKVNLAAQVAAGQGYVLLTAEPGDFQQTQLTPLPEAWASGGFDLNGDGLADLVIGAPGSDDKDIDAGRVFVVLGAGAPGSTTTLSDGLTEIIIDGVKAGDRAGSAVDMVDDLNGDGLAEILVGAPGTDRSGVADAGAAFVVWGRASPGGVDLGDPLTGGGKGYVIRGELAGDNAGQAMTWVADLTGDGRSEILVGAPGSDAGGAESGSAYVVWGKSSASIVNLTTVTAGTGGFRIAGESAGDQAGQALGRINDLNGDGLSEVLVGAAGNDAGGAEAGAVYVVFGKATGSEVNLDDVAAGIGGFKIVGQAGEAVGSALSSLGDVNADGLSDIMVSAAGSGRAYVVYGKADTAAVNLSAVAGGTGGFMILAESAGDFAGMSFATGADFNRDGVNDLVIGAPCNGEGGANAGAVYVIWGGGSGTIDLSLVAAGIGGAKIVGAAGSYTGSAVSTLGDLNGDGTADLLIGAAGQNRERATVLFTPGSWQPDFNVYGTNGADTIGAGYGGTHKVGDLADEIYGLAGVDSIHAGDGADLLDGGSGADQLHGEAGDDIYVVDVAGDQTLEDLAGGTDTVRAFLNWTLGANIENLELMGSARTGTGNALDNQITGTSGNDNLDGGLGADRLIGGGGADTYFVDQVGDVAVEAGPGGYDTVIASVNYTLGDNLEALRLAGGAHIGTGNALANTLYGGTGDDTLDGAGGADILLGGAGNDIYIVDVVGDQIQELAGGGTDIVRASLNWTLAANVETLELVGFGLSGTGNTGDNSILGTTGNDQLFGLAGIDILAGGKGDDLLDGGTGADDMTGGDGNDNYRVDDLGDLIHEAVGGGTDTVEASIDWTLTDGLESLVLTGSARNGVGNAGKNSLTGTSGDDRLDGAAGADTLTGGLGDDSYVVDNRGDKVVELASGGEDTVFASLNYTLGANVENLVLTGGARTGTGNDLDNSLTGSAKADHLYGLAGNDTLDGGAGSDVLEGGLGDDTYYIDGPGDVIIEALDGGNDTVFVNGDWTISGNVENVHLLGAGSITGDSGDNKLSGSGDDDRLDGGDGDDVELGGGGDDVLVSGSGDDVLSGGSGDDRFEIHGGKTRIEDLLGHDTLDASEAEGDSLIDLSGEEISEIEGEDCEIEDGGQTSMPLDVQFLQDLSGSFGDDIATVRGLIPGLISALTAVQSDAQFGSSTFVDKPVSPFGAGGDWVYDTILSQTGDAAALSAAYAGMVIHSGADEPEAQIEALMQLALRGAEVGFRADSARFVILFTDAPFHVAGDGSLAGILTPNNGDAVLDGGGTGEDYPAIVQLRDALLAANIIPIFAVAGGYQSTYHGLVDALGRGAVVTLSADSANVVAAVTAGLTETTRTVVEDAIGGIGNDDIRGNTADNMLDGGAGADSLRGRAGKDHLIGGAGADRLDGGEGDDLLEGGSDTDTAGYGDATAGVTVSLAVLIAQDTIGAGIDTLTGIENLSGSAFNDTLTGDRRANVIMGDLGDDLMDGGAGADTASYSSAGAGVTVSLAIVGAQDTLGAGVDSLISFENLFGSNFNDNLTGNSKANTLSGSLGDDHLDGGKGVDSLFGGSGADSLIGGAGNDFFVYAATTDSSLAASDLILDFALGDRIDLSRIDANINAAGDQGFVQAASLGGVAGQFVLSYSAGAGQTQLQADTDGDGVADFLVTFAGDVTGMTAGWVL